MNNILIIDDNHEHITAVRGALALFGYEKDNIYPSNKYTTSAMKTTETELHAHTIKGLACSEDYIDLYFYIVEQIEKYQISLIFLDLNHCPDKLGEEGEKDTPPHSSGEIIAEMLLKNDLYKNIPIVVYTRFSKADLKERKSKISDLLNLKNLYYIETHTENFAQPESFLKLLYDVEKDKLDLAIKEYNNKEYDYDLAIICALKKEFDHILKLIPDDNWKKITKYKKNYYQGFFTSNQNGKVVKVIARCMQNNMGMVTATVESHDILNFKPRYLSMTGIAGGDKNNDAFLGDVIIASHVWNWQAGKYKEGGRFSIRPDMHKTDGAIEEAIEENFIEGDGGEGVLNELIDNYGKKEIDKFIEEEIIADTESKETDIIHRGKISYGYGPMVSGSSVIGDKEVVASIEDQHGKIKSFDMEAYGIAYVAHRSPAKAIIIKGIVDYGDSSKGDKWHDFASYASAQTLYKIFTEYIDMEG